MGESSLIDGFNSNSPVENDSEQLKLRKSIVVVQGQEQPEQITPPDDSEQLTLRKPIAVIQEKKQSEETISPDDSEQLMLRKSIAVIQEKEQPEQLIPTDDSVMQPPESSTPSSDEVDSAVEAKPDLAETKEDNPLQDHKDHLQRQPLSNKEVTDHTSNLWKYLPIPEKEPEPAPEYRTVNAAYPGAKVIGARVRGKKHKHEGSNCDDWFETSYYEDVTFAAVSDGAGSRKFSRIGAKESCKTAVGYLSNEFPVLLDSVPSLREDLQLPITNEKCISVCGKLASLVQNSVLKAREAVEAAFYSRSTDPAYIDILHRKLMLEDLSGTLLVALIVPIRKETKEHLIVTCQVGDGMTVSINTKGTFQSSIKLLGVADSGEFTGETEFLTSRKMKTVEELQKRTKLSIGPVDTVLMMSDGVADDYYPNETQMRRLYFDLIANGILRTESETKSIKEISPEQWSLVKKIPNPISYPWVNDKSIMVRVQYTNRICEIMNISMESLWEQREILALASLEVKQEPDTTNEAAKLNQWLDNYYERGSFDDRTLVIIEL